MYLRAGTAESGRDIIKAREEFSLPLKLDLKPKQKQIKARLPSPAENNHGSAVKIINKLALSPLLRWV